MAELVDYRAAEAMRKFFIRSRFLPSIELGDRALTGTGFGSNIIWKCRSSI
jgi:hypothetical protein